MLTGLEPAIGKAVGAGAVKAFGWGTRVARGKISDRRLLDLAEEPVSLDGLQEFVSGLSEPAVADLSAFLQSAEIEHTAFALATQRMLTACGEATAVDNIAAIKANLRETLRLAVPDVAGPQRTSLLEAIFDSVDSAVSSCVVQLLGPDGDRLPPRTKASLAKSATAVSAAAVRAGDLLRELSTLNDYRTFERDFRQQVLNLHGTMRLPHAGTSRQVPYERLFVAPTVKVAGRDEETDTDDGTALSEMMGHCVRAILLGDPGGGKSTSSLKLAYDVAAGKARGISATVPFLVVLKDYAEQYLKSRVSMIDWISSMCEAPYGVQAPPGVLEYLLLSGRALVIFDGLDELLDTSLRREVVQVVEGFSHRYPLTPTLVTSRRVGYEEAPLDPDLFAGLQLQEFSDEQVEAYVRKWFSLDDAIAAPRKSQMANSFLKDSEFVQDLRVNPLMLSLMCGIYASENYIPRNRPDVYEKCALLLFDRWDKQRGINAPLSFDAHVQAAMRSLALWLYPRQESQQGLPREQLVRYMTDYLLESGLTNKRMRNKLRLSSSTSAKAEHGC
jgi:hypothetical protein